MKTIKSHLTETGKEIFGSKKQAQVHGMTIKYWMSMNGEIMYNIHKGKGTSSSVYSTQDFYKAVLFCKETESKNIEYKHIENTLSGLRGGAYFFKDTGKLFDETHPFARNYKLV